MTAGGVASAVLLAGAVGVVLVCAFGLLPLRDALDRLHALGPATLLGPTLVALAAAVAGLSAQEVVKTALAAALVVATGPILAHATARAEHIRRAGRAGEGGP